MAEKVLELLKRTKIEVMPETFALVSLRNEDWLKLLENPEHSPRMTAPFSIFKDKWEITMLVDEIDFESMRVGLREAKIERGFRLLSFDVELDFSVVGFFAFVAQKLADAGIPIFALSAFSRDHLLIKQNDLAKSLLVLRDYVEDIC
jgi:hypothetical protein